MLSLAEAGVHTVPFSARDDAMQEAREFCSPSQSAKATRDHDPHKAHDPVGTLATIPSALNGRFSARGQLVCSPRTPKHAHTATTIHHVTGREGSHEMRQAVPHGRTHTRQAKEGTEGLAKTVGQHHSQAHVLQRTSSTLVLSFAMMAGCPWPGPTTARGLVSVPR